MSKSSAQGKTGNPVGRPPKEKADTLSQIMQASESESETKDSSKKTATEFIGVPFGDYIGILK